MRQAFGFLILLIIVLGIAIPNVNILHALGLAVVIGLLATLMRH